MWCDTVFAGLKDILKPIGRKVPTHTNRGAHHFKLEEQTLTYQNYAPNNQRFDFKNSSFDFCILTKQLHRVKEMHRLLCTSHFDLASALLHKINKCKHTSPSFISWLQQTAKISLPAFQNTADFWAYVILRFERWLIHLEKNHRKHASSIRHKRFLEDLRKGGKLAFASIKPAFQRHQVGATISFCKLQPARVRHSVKTPPLAALVRRCLYWTQRYS